MSGLQNNLREFKLDVHGISTHVELSGAGEPLFLIHGVGGPQTWQKVLEPLSRHFQVIVPHLPGFGKSACPPGKFSTDDYGEAIDAVREKLEISAAAVAGTSYGGQIAATFALRHPDRVRKLILVASTGLSQQQWYARSNTTWIMFSTCLKHTLLRSRKLLELSGRRSFYDLRNRPADLTENFFAELRENGKRDVWLNCLRNLSTPSEDFRRQLATLTAPTLILWGGNDRAVPSNDALEFLRSIPRASLKIFSECAHSVPLEKPDEVCEAIVEFCATK